MSWIETTHLPASDYVNRAVAQLYAEWGGTVTVQLTVARRKSRNVKLNPRGRVICVLFSRVIWTPLGGFTENLTSHMDAMSETIGISFAYSRPAIVTPAEEVFAQAHKE